MKFNTLFLILIYHVILFYYATIYNIHEKQSNAFVGIAIFFKFFIYYMFIYLTFSNFFIFLATKVTNTEWQKN